MSLQTSVTGESRLVVEGNPDFLGEKSTRKVEFRKNILTGKMYIGISDRANSDFLNILLSAEEWRMVLEHTSAADIAAILHIDSGQVTG